MARVDVSVDGGVTYNTAIGTTTWSYNWTPTSPGLASIRSRAVDTSGNQQPPPQAVIVTVVDPGSPLKIVMMTPESGATGVSTGVAPMAMFSKSLNLGSLSAANPDIATILLLDASNNPVRFNLFIDVPTLRIILVPQSQLQPWQTYTVIFKGGPNEPHITDEAGMPLFPITYGHSPRRLAAWVRRLFPRRPRRGIFLLRPPPRQRSLSRNRWIPRA